MKKFTAICSVALLTLTLPGCAYLTREGRQRKAYEHYVKKQSKTRSKQQAKLFRTRPWMPPQSEPSAPVVATQLGDGPMSVSSGE